MIDSKFLMKGNLIDVLNESGVISQYTGYNWTVVELRRDSVIVEKKGIAELQISYERLSHITLTEEWFNRMSFEKISRDFYLEVEKNDVCYSQIIAYESGRNKYDVRLWVNSIPVSKEINYLHELMNLFKALTNKELTIKEVI